MILLSLNKFDALIDELKASVYDVLDKHEIKIKIEQDAIIDEALCKLIRDQFIDTYEI
jgi:hypothetical protein